ncbi:histidine phosphatase family protein [Clostridium subterminale]|uniref:Histidine phosphatase family protein n=1 Tax=Clostridium subterminale TaxID=1550 RepID=A0ABP3W9V9_CLOSU
MDIIVIRHGQSEADILNVHEGRADFPLTKLGNKQGLAMSNFLSTNYNIDKIYSSPLKRASETAKILSTATNTPIIYEDRLMEFNNGLLAGLSREEANERYPEPAIRWPHTSMYGMESIIEFRTRAESILSKIVSENSYDSTIAIVAHGGIINMLFRSFLDLPLNSRMFISTGDTGIHHLQVTSCCHRIVYTNKLSHLDNIDNN